MLLDPDDFDGRTPLCDWCCEPAEHRTGSTDIKSRFLCDPCYRDWLDGATGDEPLTTKEPQVNHDRN